MYGFVYIWYDRKHKRYYIGSHWGTPDDGYVCSSSWMKSSYKKRPEDFKRRIVSLVETNRTDLYNEEQKWLNMIKDHELKGTRYYNMKKFAGNHWTVINQDNRSVKEKISEKVRAKWQDPDFRHRVTTNSLAARNEYWKTDRGAIEKQRRSIEAKSSGLRPPELTPEWEEKRLDASAVYRASPEFRIAMDNRNYSEETKYRMGASMRGKKHKPETIEKIQKHGHCRIGNESKTHAAWRSMKYNAKRKNIDIEQNWHKFDGFIADMGECPPDYRLNRKDNNLGFIRGNCRWIQ